jgi:hypothetical protein
MSPNGATPNIAPIALTEVDMTTLTAKLRANVDGWQFRLKVSGPPGHGLVMLHLKLENWQDFAPEQVADWLHPGYIKAACATRPTWRPALKRLRWELTEGDDVPEWGPAAVHWLESMQPELGQMLDQFDSLRRAPAGEEAEDDA